MRLPNIEWNLLTLVDLQRLRERLDQEIESREKKFDKIEKIKQMMGDEGLTMEDILQATSKLPRRENKKAGVKYRHPKKPDLQWSGRGKQPIWLREELSKGKKLDYFLA